MLPSPLLLLKLLRPYRGSVVLALLLMLIEVAVELCSPLILARFDTMLSQHSNGISQGQRQLLAIARVILANPAILVLDEATSNIDTVTEVVIQEALLRLMKGRTSLIVAHRLNTTRQADLIVVMQNGRITEQGSYASLLQAGGHYHALHTGSRH